MIADPGTNPGKHPAPKANREQLGRSPEDQSGKRTPGAAPKERRLLLSLHSRADGTGTLNEPSDHY